VVVEEGADGWEASADIRVTHATPDTSAHLAALEGIEERPEFVTPRRDWRPLGVSVLYTAIVSGTAVALHNSDLAGARGPIVGVSVFALAAGILQTAKQPEPQRVEANVEYNRMVRQLLETRNDDIARLNELLRRQTRITIVQLNEGSR
jgi:hypothetical protein